MGPRKERQRELAGSGELAFWVRGRLDAGLTFDEIRAEMESWGFRPPALFGIGGIDVVIRVSPWSRSSCIGRRRRRRPREPGNCERSRGR